MFDRHMEIPDGMKMRITFIHEDGKEESVEGITKDSTTTVSIDVYDITLEEIQYPITALKGETRVRFNIDMRIT